MQRAVTEEGLGWGQRKIGVWESGQGMDEIKGLQEATMSTLGASSEPVFHRLPFLSINLTHPVDFKLSLQDYPTV